ncbi:hypothetical protein G5I_09243 [Acromyrmex echinatior]|uniref:Uncharacterized protein n=1 Tax=Acromyrmex echinatior TaxID=103372 RepID=F4WTN7_ACREC|nr:hypothetical protein G5I_09243 [Acromyrmex echinatior]
MTGVGGMENERRWPDDSHVVEMNSDTRQLNHLVVHSDIGSLIEAPRRANCAWVDNVGLFTSHEIFSSRREFMKVYDLVYHSRIHYVIIATVALAQQMSFSKALMKALFVFWNASSGNTSTDDRCLTVTPFFRLDLLEESQQEFATARLFVNKCTERDHLARIVDKTRMFRTEMRNALIDVRLVSDKKSTQENSSPRKTELSVPLCYRCRLPSLNTLASAHDVPPTGCCGRYPVEIIFVKNVTNRSVRTKKTVIYSAMCLTGGRRDHCANLKSKTEKEREREKGLANETACHGDEWGDLARRSRIACVPRRAPWDD